MRFKYPKLYLEFVKQNIKVMLEYRVDFIIGALSTFLMQLGGILFVWVVFENIHDLNGWSFYEVTFVYGLLTMGKAINHIFFDNLWVLGQQYIRQGRFDILLLRPISPLFHLIADKLQQDGFGHLLVGIIIMNKSMNELNIHMGAIDILMLIIFILSSGAIFSALNLITSIGGFWTVNSNALMWPVFSTHEFALYPLSIYHKLIRIALTWVVPYAFASFYPVNYFLDKGYKNMAYLTPVVAIVLWMIGLRVWNFGIKHYSSTGS